MSHKNKVFYRGDTEVSVDFSAEEISSDESIVLFRKVEREHKLLDYFSSSIPDKREPLLTTHTVNKMLKQRVFMLMQGYEDANDVYHLQNNPLYKDILEGYLTSQPTISRFENSLNKHAIFDLCYAWITRYVSTLEGRKKITIDIDATDDPTYGNQQMSMFNPNYAIEKGISCKRR